MTINTLLHSCPVWLPLTQNWMYTQTAHLPQGVRNEVVCSSSENLDRFPVDSCRVMPTPFLARIPLLRRLAYRRGWVPFRGFLDQHLKTHRPDLVYSHFGTMGWSDSPVVKRHRLPHVVRFYGFDLGLPHSDLLWKERYEPLWSDAHMFLVEGPFMGQTLEGLGCPGEKIRVHPLGVNLDTLSYRPPDWSPDEPLGVLMAGSFREKKGLPDGLRALARLRETTPLRVTLIGDASDHPKDRAEKVRIQSVLRETGLQEVTRCLGYQPLEVLHKEAQDHQVFLAPSKTAQDGDTEGGAPVVLTEMAALGRVIVSTDHADIPQVVPHDSCSRLARQGEVEDLASQLQWVVNHVQEWPAMTARARDHVHEKFHPQKQGQALFALLEEAQAMAGEAS